MDVVKELTLVKDEKYRSFQSSLIPNIDEKTVIGVRTPELRAIAAKLSKAADKEDFLEALPHFYYEENQIHFMTISLIKDYEECLNAVNKFLPYVDNWAVSDQSSPKAFKKQHEKIIYEIKRWIESDHVYTARFGIRMLMNEFLEEDFKPEYLELVADKKGEDYYLKMMQAWFFATALAKQYDATLPYITENKLELWIHNKTIQKAVESFRITPEQKAFLKAYRIKKDRIQ